MKTRIGAVLLLATLASVTTAAEPFTLSESIAAHSSVRLETRGTVIPPKGSYVAWRDGGGLYAAAAPHFKTREIVAPRADAPIDAAFASTDERTVFFVRGTVQRAFGPHPSVDSRELWRVDIRGGQAQLVAKGGDVPSGKPVFAPDGESFATAEGVMLYEYRLADGGLKRRPLLKNDAQHYAAVGLSSLAYSPDGTQLAFVSSRKAGQSYIGIHDFGTGDYRYVDAGIFRDLSPVWSPDGRRIAFVRVPGNWTEEYRFTPMLEGAPWSIVIADAKEGSIRTLWQAARGTGSVFQPFGSDSWMEPDTDAAQLHWTSSGEILFPYEKTGWLQLYTVSADGGRETLLTPGEGEVTLPTLSSDGRYALYASNIGDLARLHVWRVALNGGAPEQLTRGRGVESSPAALAGGRYAYVGNIDGRLPNRRNVVLENGRTMALTTRVTEDRRQQHLWQQFVDPQVVPVRAADGITTYHLVMTPKGKPPAGGYPVIVASKGGPNGRVSPGNGAYSALGQYAVSHGYVFVEINYRGCFGFGLSYRYPAERGATGGSEVNDLEALAKYLTSRPDVDAKRIGIMGGSYGGHIVGLAMTRLPQYFAAGAHLSGVGDWVTEMRKDGNAPPEYIRLSERTRIEELAFEASPAIRMDAWKAPTLFTMGELDTSGHMESIIDLGYRLLQQGTHVEFSIAPEAGHSGDRARPMDKVFAFFERQMGK